MTIRHPTQAELFADVACQGPRPPLSSMAGMDRVDAAVVISPEAVSTTTPKILDRNDKPATLAEAYEAACAAEWASKDKLIGLRSSLRLIERATSRKLRELPAYPPELGPILEAVRPDNIRSDTDASNQSGVSSEAMVEREIGSGKVASGIWPSDTPTSPRTFAAIGLVSTPKRHIESTTSRSIASVCPILRREAARPE